MKASPPGVRITCQDPRGSQNFPWRRSISESPEPRVVRVLLLPFCSATWITVLLPFLVDTSTSYPGSCPRSICEDAMRWLPISKGCSGHLIVHRWFPEKRGWLPSVRHCTSSECSPAQYSIWIFCRALIRVDMIADVKEEAISGTVVRYRIILNVFVESVVLTSHQRRWISSSSCTRSGIDGFLFVAPIPILVLGTRIIQDDAATCSSYSSLLAFRSPHRGRLKFDRRVLLLTNDEGDSASRMITQQERFHKR